MTRIVPVGHPRAGREFRLELRPDETWLAWRQSVRRRSSSAFAETTV